MGIDINSFSKVIYIDNVNGSDTTGTGEKDKPYYTITKGTEQAIDNTMVILGEGIYTITSFSNLSKSDYSISYIGKGLETHLQINTPRDKTAATGNISVYNMIIEPTTTCTYTEGLVYDASDYTIKFNNILFKKNTSGYPTLRMCMFSNSSSSTSTVKNKYFNNCTFIFSSIQSDLGAICGCSTYVNNCAFSSTQALTTATSSQQGNFVSCVYECIFDEKYQITNNDNKLYGVYSGDNKWLTYKFIIKENGKYYTIKEEKYIDGKYVELTEEERNDFDNFGFKLDELNVEITVGEETFKPISKFSKVTFITSSEVQTLSLNSIQSKQELVVASNNFATTVQSNIDFFDVVGITDTGTSIKVAFSIDNGATWKSYDTEFKDLSITIPNKHYEELIEEELVQWNNARDVISEQGIDIANLSKIDFNTLDMEKIRFAYVLSINSKDNKCCTSQLKWQFDSKGTMKSMTSDELEVELLQDSIKVTPKISSDMIKINFSNGSSSNINIDNLSDEDIQKLKTRLGLS